MTTAPFKFNEIGYWSELKLEIVEKYGSAYTKAFANQKGLKKYYIDAFSGAGVHVLKRTRGQVEGSPARALKVSPPFDHFYFIDMDANKTKHLAALCPVVPTLTFTQATQPRISHSNFYRLSNTKSSTALCVYSTLTGCISTGM